MTAPRPESPASAGPPAGTLPPPGPGVAPPFPAPPTEGRTARLWLGLGAAALAVVLICGGGTAALIGLSIASTRAVGEQAHTVVSEYLDSLGKDDFGKAYDLLCARSKAQESPEAFEERVSREPKIRSYRIGEPGGSNEVRVPVDVTYAQGGHDQLIFSLVPESTGLRVCGVG